jgi:membrane-associated phospholipid phosphatase
MASAAAVGVVFALALAIDRPVGRWVHNSGLDVALKTNWQWARHIGRLAGNFLTFTLVAAVWMFCLGKRWWRAAAFVLLSGVLSGTNSLVKWIVGRPRPYQGGVYQVRPFVHGLHGLFGPNQAFPSGDVCLAAATAASLYILFPRWRWLWVGLVLLTAVERVAENAHHPSDVVAGAVLGWLMAQWAWRLMGRPAAPTPAPRQGLSS